MLRSARRTAATYFISRKAVGDGTQDAQDREAPTSQPSRDAPVSIPARDDGPVRYVRRVNLPAESFGRPAQMPANVVTEQAPIPDAERALRAGPAPRRRSLTFAPAPERQTNEIAAHPHLPEPTQRSSGASRQRLYEPSGPAHASALTGTLVDEVPAWHPGNPARVAARLSRRSDQRGSHHPVLRPSNQDLLAQRRLRDRGASCLIASIVCFAGRSGHGAT